MPNHEDYTGIDEECTDADCPCQHDCEREGCFVETDDNGECGICGLNCVLDEVNGE